MGLRTVLYRLDRGGFDAVARAYYRAPRFRLAAPAASEVLDVGERPLELAWPLSVHALPGLPLAWHDRVRAAYRTAWADLHRQGPWPSTLREAVAGGKPLAHADDRPGTGATFFAPAYARRFAPGLDGSGPHAAPVRDALRALQDALDAEREQQAAIHARLADFDRDLKATFDAVGRLDVARALVSGASLLSRFATASRDVPVPPKPMAELEKVAGFLAGVRSDLNAWEASDASARLDALRRFYDRARAEKQYVVIERSAQPGDPSRTRRTSEGIR